MILRFLRWLVSLFEGTSSSPVPVYIVPKPTVPEPDVPLPPIVVGRGTLNCNFLAFAPHWEMGDDRTGDCGLFYFKWPKEKRARFREDYLAAGFTDLPICVMPGGDGLPATKEGSLDLAYELEEELHASGMRWLHMLITDRGDSPMTYGEAVAWAEYIIPRTHADFLCTGWEFPDPTRGGGFAVADGTEWGWSGDVWKLLDFLAVLHGLAPFTPLDLHFRPGWWAPAGPDDTDDHTLWQEGRDRGLPFGLLYQPRLDEVTTAHPDPDEGAAYWAFEYPGVTRVVRASRGVSGAIRVMGHSAISRRRGIKPHATFAWPVTTSMTTPREGMGSHGLSYPDAGLHRLPGHPGGDPLGGAAVDLLLLRVPESLD